MNYSIYQKPGIKLTTKTATEAAAIIMTTMTITTKTKFKCGNQAKKKI